MKTLTKVLKVCLFMLLVGIAVPAVSLLFEIPDPLTALAVLPILPAVGSLKTSIEIKQRRSDLNNYLNALNQLALDEKRDLTADEQKEWEKYNTEFRELGEKLKKIEQDEQRMAEMAGQFRNSSKAKEEKEVRKYNLLKAIQQRAENNLDGLELEMHQEAVKEARDSGVGAVLGLGVPTIALNSLLNKRSMNVTGQTSVAGDQGGMLVETEKSGLVMALRPRLVLAQLGASTIGGMVGNFDVVKGTSTVAGWEDENSDSNDTSIATSTQTMSPKRLSAITTVSKQLLIQSSEDLQAKILNDILAAIAQNVELAAIAGTGAAAKQPVGILSTSGIGSVIGGENGLKPTLAKLIDLETEVAIDNADIGSMAYLTNAKVRGILKQTAVDAGSGLMVWPANSKEVNGYPVGVSNLVPSNLTKGTANAICSAIIFGSFSNLEIFNWGGLDIVVDPYTAKKKGQIEISVDSFWDVFVKRPEAFAAMLDALTA